MNSNNSDYNLTKKDIDGLVKYGLGMEYSWNYERQMNLAFCRMVIPNLKKIYHDDPEGYREALERHLEFFNITPQLAPFVGGIVVAMEEKNKVDPDFDPSSISAVKSALMGPLSGIGDSIFIGAIRVIALGVGLSLSMEGNPLGPILYLLIYNIPAFYVRFAGARKGYELGVDYLARVEESGLMSKLMVAAGILGLLVIGGMTKEMVYTEFSFHIGAGETAKSFQEIMDGIMPGALGLGVTWLYYWMLSKNINPVILIISTIVIGILGVGIGIF